MKKQEAFNVLLDWKKHGKIPTPVELDGLLAYFAPAKSKVVKDPIAWVAKAVNLKDAREALRYMRVMNGMLYGTDGMRIHSAPTELPDGFYDPKSLQSVTLTDNVTSKFPDERAFNRIFQLPEDQPITIKLGDTTTDMMNDNDGKPKKIGKFTEQLTVNYTLLSDSLNHNPDQVMQVYHDTKNKCCKVFAETEFGKVILMGMSHA